MDKSIYIAGIPHGFTISGYRYSLAHPVIRQLYTQYKDWRQLPKSMPISDAERRSFEKNIDKMIADGKIEVESEKELNG